MNWYKRYIGDYQRDTSHLSLVEHGAYVLLLDAHYATAKPLPKGRSALYRITRAVTPEEQGATISVINEFWEPTEGGFINRRAGKPPN